MSNGDPEILPILLLGLYVYLVAVTPMIVVALPLFMAMMLLLELLK